MSYQTRLRGFVACFILGWVLSFCSVIAVSLGNINGFVLLYSLGNAVAIFATMFLMGPMRQLRAMFAPVRVIATLIFLGLLVGTIVVAVQTKNFVAVLICVILQFLAGVWYSISYIPYGEFVMLSNSAEERFKLTLFGVWSSRIIIIAREMVLSICCPAGTPGTGV